MKVPANSNAQTQGMIIPQTRPADINPVYLQMAAADMHANGRLFEAEQIEEKVNDSRD